MMNPQRSLFVPLLNKINNAIEYTVWEKNADIAQSKNTKRCFALMNDLLQFFLITHDKSFRKAYGQIFLATPTHMLLNNAHFNVMLFNDVIYSPAVPYFIILKRTFTFIK